MTADHRAVELSRRLRAYVKAEAKYGAEVSLDPDTAEAAADTIDALRARLAEAEAVIAPFAEAGREVAYIDDTAFMPTPGSMVISEVLDPFSEPKVDDLRRAAAFTATAQGDP